MRTTEDLLIWPTPGNRCWAAFGEDQQDKIFALKLLHRRKRARYQTPIFAQQRKPKQTNLNSSPSSFLVCLTSHIKSVNNLYILNLSRIHSLNLHCLLNSYHRSICLHPLHSCISHNADSCLFKREI